MEVLCCVVLILVVINHTNSQFITVGTNNIRNKTVKNKCDSSSNSALVEHFFNVVFNEFHNTPPGCVCVQMCPDQPTYCYPNGCLKKADVNKKPEVTLPVAKFSDNTKPIFFLEEKTDFINDFLDKNYVDENKPVVIPGPVKQETIAPIILRPDPFKDRYKVLFKYKKLPKVELKYNLGEQVKNTKSDVIKKENVDVSKTRWPMNKVNPHFNGQRTRSDTQDTTKYFMSMFLDKDVANYPPKYFKRDLANNTSEDDQDMKTINVVGENTPENTTFSLESLIDNLIKSGIEHNKTSNVVKKSNSANNYKSDIQIVDTTETMTNHKATVKTSVTERMPLNETTRIISMNFTKEHIDKNKYIKTNTENETSKLSEMIASLSKKIEMQNNTSLEIMRQMTGVIVYDSTSKTDDIQLKENILNETITFVTTENTLTTDRVTRTTKKIRQRLARRLQNSKNN